jgi:HAMP domain-containing protein
MSAMVFVGLAGLLAIFALLGISSASEATQQVLSERVTLARLSATTLDASLRQIQSVLTIAGNQSTLQELGSPSAERLAILNAAYEEIKISSQGVYLLGPDGSLTTAYAGKKPEIDWKGVPAVQAALQWDGNTPQLSIVPGARPQAVLAVPLLDPGGLPAGVLAALLDFSNSPVFPPQRPINLGKTGAIEVIDSRGVVLLSSHPDQALKAEDLEKFLSRLFVSGAPVVETCLGCYGENNPDSGDEVIAFAPLTQAPWGVVVRQKAAEAFAPVRILMVRILILSLVSVAGASGLVWVTTSSVIHPVQLLTGAAKRIADGDLSTPIKLPFESTPRKDEIGALGESFIRMRQRLKQSIDEIHSWNRELDARVQERTQAALIAQLEAQAARDDLEAVIDALSDELIVVNVEDYSINRRTGWLGSAMFP